MHTTQYILYEHRSWEEQIKGTEGMVQLFIDIFAVLRGLLLIFSRELPTNPFLLRGRGGGHYYLGKNGHKLISSRKKIHDYSAISAILSGTISLFERFYTKQLDFYMSQLSQRNNKQRFKQKQCIISDE